MKEAEQTVLTPLVSLDTPGKATVQVVILADPVSLLVCSVPPSNMNVFIIGWARDLFCWR